MVVMEILTGIALVQKSVSFIKSNINTVKDIKGIAQQIDSFFTGEAQMNKKQGKGMSIAQQFGSVESTAASFIDRKLLEEQRQELKMIINLRFGPYAWDEIITERATKIAEAKEANRLARIEAHQKQKEIIDTLQTIGLVFCVIAVVIIGLVTWLKSY
tara:strand:- start:42 stop:515 length:474 start_codon:yes stop_codon:yes gene_type:complete